MYVLKHLKGQTCEMSGFPVSTNPNVTDDTPEQHLSMSKHQGKCKEQTCGGKGKQNVMVQPTTEHLLQGLSVLNQRIWAC